MWPFLLSMLFPLCFSTSPPLRSGLRQVSVLLKRRSGFSVLPYPPLPSWTCCFFDSGGPFFFFVLPANLKIAVVGAHLLPFPFPPAAAAACFSILCKVNLFSLLLLPGFFSPYDDFCDFVRLVPFPPIDYRIDFSPPAEYTLMLIGLSGRSFCKLWVRFRSFPPSFTF